MKKDLFGTVEIVAAGESSSVRRDAGRAARGLRWLARRLLLREAAALAVLEHVDGVPALLAMDGSTLDRSYLPGRPMHEGRPGDPAYFRQAARLVRHLHRAGVAHNDLAKEPNFLVLDDGRPAIVDFQLAHFAPRRGALFRLLAREDLRHLLKHKRTYCPQQLTRRELALLARPSLPSRLWQLGGKPVYRFVTRRLLGWRDREGAGDRF